MPLLPAAKAWQIITSEIKPLGRELVDLASAWHQPIGEKVADLSGRVIAEDIFSPVNIPPFNNSAMDGFALSFARWQNSPQKIFFVYPRTISAGDLPSHKKLKKNYLWRVMTGAPLPDGCDLVIPQEYGKTRPDGQIKIAGSFSRYANVRFAGEDIKKGEKVISAGQEITPLTLALLVAMGRKKIYLYRRPKVALITSGKEVILPTKKLLPGQIYNVNAYTLSLLTAQAGAVPEMFFHSGDNPRELSRVLRRALRSVDLILISAGVSVGKYDYTRRVLEKLGAKILFHRLAIKPARPLLLARWHRKIIFGIPGNPASTVVAFRLFVRPAINRMTGRPGETALRRETGYILKDFRKSTDRRNFVRAKKIIRQGKVYLQPVGPHGSNMIKSLGRSDVLIDFPKNVCRVKKGQLVKYFSW